MRKFLKFLRIFFSVLFICMIIGVIVLFTTSFGHDVRKLAAATILSTQHRDWAVYTFLPDHELQQMIDDIDNPKYINSKGLTTGLKEREKIAIEHKDFTKEGLVVTVEDVSETFSDHYYKGKLMTISNPLNVKIATPKGSQGNDFGEQIHVMAKREGAIGAVNANGFNDPNGVGNGGEIMGISIQNQKVISDSGGKDTKDYIGGITGEGLFVTGFYSPNELLEMDMKEVAGFRPQLIVNGEKMITEGDGGWGYGPRTIMGQKEDGSIVFLVIDGRQTHSIGASMKDCQDFLYKKGVINAIAMDGGSSSSMYFRGDNITTPSSKGNIPRYLPNAWVVVPKEGQDVSIYENGEKVK